MELYNKTFALDGCWRANWSGWRKVYFRKCLPIWYGWYYSFQCCIDVVLGKQKDKTIPSHWTFASSIGALAGFTTMVGNLAGAFSNIYFLAMRLPKNTFIGTAAWLFFIINSFKIPFHIWSWETINNSSILKSLELVPFVLLGLVSGVYIVKRIKDDSYRKLILIFTALGGIAILFN